ESRKSSGEQALLDGEPQNQDLVEPEVACQHKAARRIGLDHVRVRPAVAADGKAPVRRAGRVRGAYRTLIAFDVGRGAEFAVRPDGKYGHVASLVVGYEHVLAGGVDAQMGRAGPFRADGIEQRQMSTRA